MVLRGKRGAEWLDTGEIDMLGLDVGSHFNDQQEW
jgi:hypothetical protein